MEKFCQEYRIREKDTEIWYYGCLVHNVEYLDKNLLKSHIKKFKKYKRNTKNFLLRIGHKKHGDGCRYLYFGFCRIWGKVLFGIEIHKTDYYCIDKLMWHLTLIDFLFLRWKKS